MLIVDALSKKFSKDLFIYNDNAFLALKPKKTAIKEFHYARRFI